MTVFALSRQKLIPFRLIPSYASLREYFSEINRGGIITLVFSALLAASLLAYIALIFFAFHLGFILQEKEREAIKIEQALILLELNSGKFSSDFTKINNEILSGMEKISEVKYIIPSSVANSRAIQVQ